MRKYFRNLKEDKLLLRLFIGSFLLIIITIVYIAVFYTKLPPLLPVFNQLAWGETRLGETWAIFIPSIVVLAILIINIFISNFSQFFQPSSQLRQRVTESYTHDCKDT